MHPKFQARLAKVAIEKLTKQAREMVVINDGPRCAAWLVRAHHRQFRVGGSHRWEILTSKLKELPTWFWAAIECLKRRPLKWKVEVVNDARKRVYQVHWLGWGGVKF